MERFDPLWDEMEPFPEGEWVRYVDAMAAVADEGERLRRALHDIAEEWAGAECGEPVYAQEAYAIGLAQRMYALAAEALRLNAQVRQRL
jgi:hypothetical protein